jgi:hypothetical protein
MPNRLHCYYGVGYLHFITTSCYQRCALLGQPAESRPVSLVFSEKKRVERLRYMHRNPVKRGLVLEPEQWAWRLSGITPMEVAARCW